MYSMFLGFCLCTPTAPSLFSPLSPPFLACINLETRKSIYTLKKHLTVMFFSSIVCETTRFSATTQPESPNVYKTMCVFAIRTTARLLFFFCTMLNLTFSLKFSSPGGILMRWWNLSLAIRWSTISWLFSLLKGHLSKEKNKNQII